MIGLLSHPAWSGVAAIAAVASLLLYCRAERNWIFRTIRWNSEHVGRIAAYGLLGIGAGALLGISGLLDSLAASGTRSLGVPLFYLTVICLAFIFVPSLESVGQPWWLLAVALLIAALLAFFVFSVFCWFRPGIADAMLRTASSLFGGIGD